MSLYRLKRVAETAAPEDRAWLLAAIAIYEGGDGLESALGVKGTRALIRRNECLIEALRVIDPDESLSPWKRAGELEKEIKRVECRGARDTTLDALIAEAMSCGQMLRSQRWIYELMS